VVKQTFNRLDWQMDERLMRWAAYRHPRKTRHWRRCRYWRQEGMRLVFSDGKKRLRGYAEVSIRRHVKVRGEKSPYDGIGCIGEHV
jgi:RNA-directed DNA polymerase